jgi:hypothetical protein
MIPLCARSLLCRPIANLLNLLVDGVPYESISVLSDASQNYLLNSEYLKGKAPFGATLLHCSQNELAEFRPICRGTAVSISGRPINEISSNCSTTKGTPGGVYGEAKHR